MKIRWLDNGGEVSPDDLKEVGIAADWIDPDKGSYLDAMERWKQKRDYVAHDEVTLTPETPNIDKILTIFWREHKHADDEARYIVSGAGVFDIRSMHDKWIRIEVGAGDFVIIPANVYHRFELTESRQIHAVRLFKDNPSWEAIFR